MDINVQPSVVIVDDNVMFNEMMQIFIARLNLKSESYFSGEELLQRNMASKTNIYLLDENLPGIRGSEIAKKIRATDQFSPIFIISGEADENTIFASLYAGADDYIIKPINTFHLQMKIFNALAKLKFINDLNINMGLKFIANSTIVCLKGKFIHLSSNEHSLMKMLHHKYGIYVSKEELLTSLGNEVCDKNVDVYIHSLRKKFADHNFEIQNSRGRGYRLQWVE